ncbi:hypothetical protein AA0312_1087 [Acetobacter tropicalis NRIC 0312]|uniref:Uncharacterized protein n=1 Tax=Acetobacter tropicalis TaxID=104102 RepID=A0A511FR80_9PROT|nr:hypothetical protein ATR1_443d0002 [Acetobacter tropicalis]GBR68798.1 hypothetical protein AA0312_1087 [Acetobacter tropicalis NRIC 0312]GEL51461.1 hypothetical protein ATR01nite_25360 [Acetobacter tropicalis]
MLSGNRAGTAVDSGSPTGVKPDYAIGNYGLTVMHKHLMRNGVEGSKNPLIWGLAV